MNEAIKKAEEEQKANNYQAQDEEMYKSNDNCVRERHSTRAFRTSETKSHVW
jgi:hypothetical protein